MAESLPIPAQLKAQLEKCKTVRNAESYYKPRNKTEKVLLLFQCSHVDVAFIPTFHSLQSFIIVHTGNSGFEGKIT